MHGLGECSVAGGIPGGETDPLLAGSVERNAVAMGGEGRQRSCGQNFAVGRLAVAPDQFDEFGRPGPIDGDHEGAPGPGPLNALVMQYPFAKSNKEVTGTKSLPPRRPAVGELREAVELDVVDIQLR